MFQERYSGVFMVGLEYIFEVCNIVWFSEIFKSLYKQQWKSLWQSLLLVKLQAFTVNNSERFNGIVCLLLHDVTGLFLVYIQDFIINSSDGVCGRVCNRICL